MSRLTSLFISWNTIRRIFVIGSAVGRDNNRRRILPPLPSSSPPPLFLFFASRPCSLLEQQPQHHYSSTTCRIIHRNRFHNSQFSSYSTYSSTSSSLPTSLNANRYQRFRYSLQLLSQSSSQQQQQQQHQQQQLTSDNSKNHLITVGKHVMEISSSNRRSFNRTWKRLGPLLELIVASTSTTTPTLSLSSSNENRKLYSIADVGCDHGILSMSLACMAHVSSSSQQRLQEQQLPHNNDSIIDGTDNDNSNSNNKNNNKNFFFNRVYGIDLSSKALDDGALQTLKKIINAITWSSSSSIAEYYYINCKSNNENNSNNNNTELLPIEFRISNGLEALHIGEADAIVLAGMGVETMMEILFLDNDGRRSGKDTVITPPIDRVRTNHIYLQPANSRPQHMMKLYDRIQQTGEWILGNESIAYSSGRWYINSFFERRRQQQQLQQQNQQSNNDDGGDDDDDDDNDDVGGDSRFHFPGHFLVQQVTMNDNENVYDSYIKHHLQWLKDDCERTPKYVREDEDRRWIEYITSNKK